MKIARLAAAAVTVLMALMNLGTLLPHEDVDTWVKAFGGVAGLLGLVAAAALMARTAWGRSAVIAVGVLNVVGAVVALALSEDGAVVGLVIGALGAVLGALAGTSREVHPAIG